MFYAIPTARVILTVKTSLDVFRLRREQVLTFSVLGDRIYDGNEGVTRKCREEILKT